MTNEYLIVEDFEKLEEAAKIETSPELLRKILLGISSEVIRDFLKEEKVKVIQLENSLYLHIKNQDEFLKELFEMLHLTINKFIKEIEE